MARFDVFRARDDGTYLLDVQATLLDRLETRVVVPLLPIDRAPHDMAALIRGSTWMERRLRSPR